MKSKKIDEIEDLWAPFNAIKPLFSKIPDERMKAANESLIADLLGEQPKNPGASELEPEAINLMYAILHLYGSMNRFEIYKTMFQYYPWKNRISKADHIQSAFYLVVHECYIFEERLGNFFDCTSEFAEKRNIQIGIKKIARL